MNLKLMNYFALVAATMSINIASAKADTEYKWKGEELKSGNNYYIYSVGGKKYLNLLDEEAKSDISSAKCFTFSADDTDYYIYSNKDYIGFSTTKKYGYVTSLSLANSKDNSWSNDQFKYSNDICYRMYAKPKSGWNERTYYLWKYNTSSNKLSLENKGVNYDVKQANGNNYYWRFISDNQYSSINAETITNKLKESLANNNVFFSWDSNTIYAATNVNNIYTATESVNGKGQYLKMKISGLVNQSYNITLNSYYEGNDNSKVFISANDVTSTISNNPSDTEVTLSDVTVVDGNLIIYVYVDDNNVDNVYASLMNIDIVKTNNVDASTTINGDDFYLFNIGTGKYLEAKGTNLSLGKGGIPLSISTTTDSWLNSFIQSLGSSLSGGRTVTLINAETGVGTNGQEYLNADKVNGSAKLLYFYWIDTQNKQIGIFNEYSGLSFNTPFYASSNGDNSVLVNKKNNHDYYISAINNTFNHNDEYAIWQLQTKEDRIAQLSNATEDAPEDATFLIKDPNFGYLDSRKSGWTNYASLTEIGKIENRLLTSNKAFDIYQTFEVPNGLYQVKAQCVTTNSNSNAILYANNDYSTPFIVDKNANYSNNKSFGDEGSCSIMVYVTNGILKIGAKATNAGFNTYFDNFELTYYGPTDIDVSGYLKNPKFDNGDSYWTINGNNAEVKKNEGNQYFSNSEDNTASLSQTVYNLPDGVYSIKVKISNQSGTVKLAVDINSSDSSNKYEEVNIIGGYITISNIQVTSGDEFKVTLSSDKKFDADDFVLEYVSNSSSNPSNPSSKVDPSATEKAGTVKSDINGNVVFKGSWKGSKGQTSLNKYIALYPNATSYDFTEATFEDNATITISQKANPNLIIYFSENGNSKTKLSFSATSKTVQNIVVDGICDEFIITDKNKLSVPKDFKASSAKYTRENVTSTYGTICLPFSYCRDENISLYSLNGINGINSSATLKIVEEESINSSEPCIFKKLSTNKKVDITGAVEEDGYVLISNSQPEKPSLESTDIMLVGTYDKVVTGDNTGRNQTAAADYFYISKDKFWRGTDYFNTTAFRAYIYAPGVFDSPVFYGNARSLTLLEISVEEMETGIFNAEEITNNADIIGYFSINGTMYNQPQTGINIVKFANGKTKKIFIK